MKCLIESFILNLRTYKSCSHIKLDSWVVMPNHIHLLIFLGETIEYQTVPYTNDRAMAKSVGALVSVFKRNASKLLRKNQFNFVTWQRGYYDRIVRDEDELNRIREYIRLNPIKWAEDHEHLDRLLEKMDYHQ